MGGFRGREAVIESDAVGLCGREAAIETDKDGFSYTKWLSGSKWLNLVAAKRCSNLTRKEWVVAKRPSARKRMNFVAVKRLTSLMRES